MLKLKRVFEAEDKKALKSIKNAILRDAEVKRLTSRVLHDDGAWGPFKQLIKAIKNAHPDIISVLYGDDPHYQNGYSWQDGRMVGKNRVITIETEHGDMKGSIRCFGAGTVEDPLESYDMTLQIFV